MTEGLIIEDKQILNEVQRQLILQANEDALTILQTYAPLVLVNDHTVLVVSRWDSNEDIIHGFYNYYDGIHYVNWNLNIKYVTGQQIHEDLPGHLSERVRKRIAYIDLIITHLHELFHQKFQELILQLDKDFVLNVQNVYTEHEDLFDALDEGFALTMETFIVENCIQDAIETQNFDEQEAWQYIYDMRYRMRQENFTPREMLGIKERVNKYWVGMQLYRQMLKNSDIKGILDFILRIDPNRCVQIALQDVVENNSGVYTVKEEYINHSAIPSLTT